MSLLSHGRRVWQARRCPPVREDPARWPREKRLRKRVFGAEPHARPLVQGAETPGTPPGKAVWVRGKPRGGNRRAGLQATESAHPAPPALPMDRLDKWWPGHARAIAQGEGKGKRWGERERGRSAQQERFIAPTYPRLIPVARNELKTILQRFVGYDHLSPPRFGASLK